MAEVGGLVTLRPVGEVDSAPAAMQRVVAYDRQHFGDRISFEPFISYASGTAAPEIHRSVLKCERRVTDTSRMRS